MKAPPLGRAIMLVADGVKDVDLDQTNQLKGNRIGIAVENHLRVLHAQGGLSPGTLEHYTTLCELVMKFKDVQGQFDQYQRVTAHMHVVWKKQVLLVDISGLH